MSAEIILLGLVVLLVWLSLRIPYERGFWGTAQVVVMCLAAIAGTAWFFLSIHGMKRCLFHVRFADPSERRRGDALMCAAGFCLGVLAVAVAVGGGFLLMLLLRR